MIGLWLRIALSLVVVSALACASPTSPTAHQRAKGAVQGLIAGTVIGGLAAGPPGAAAGSAVFGLYGLVSGKSLYTGPTRHRGAVPPETLEREVEAELEAPQVPADPATPGQ